MMTQSETTRHTDLLRESYNYQLPEELIAQRPIPGRSQSRLLVYRQSSNEVIHTTFNKIGDFLPENSVIAINQSRVYPCRLAVEKSTGGKGEIFILAPELDVEGNFPALIRTSGKKKVSDLFGLRSDQPLFEIVKLNEEGTFTLKYLGSDFSTLIIEAGKIPIPPYIRKGESDQQDLEDYQTVFAKEDGSVAAPTAGLHFTPDLMNELKQSGHDFAPVTLHVGLGTFLPVKSDSLLEHKMHSENYKIEQESLKLLNAGRRIIAVGTTSLRCLESSYCEGSVQVNAGEWNSTDIFLHPGKEVHSIKGLITNFHLPESTLIMLVSAILGREKTLELYQIAVEEKYRFFSYGDAMFILRD
ncbi:MAG: tRNA preQ1(34) S-adenosylmethionine ribosyltransferase-isomerase QueA [Bdellovibrio sp. CG12_big_fil_rev_8_21_14_0_65_39_13]|nr:MAG: tRNA preQ1(34) S-adenosylmethionine ribosyltransferase-isomerase QueA [Bdellovibrio sp. CG22_combo_CG10-13_8_21_14_all_39_27]PIQ58600.1 MAG: tRNA preQ1(34) S-adenosylmethionine ribosyltransferase-isomerase QueA [Bdellovibrio sp. CG12_big_fil_rev_8_21_14_0_65_39_13]PIR33808.1 MAG: tRNA preQ1(34) S-adenosylmethionine ribosyltransferase-isomerase QueA [Bdellovibrio sp. CG11_big_fil_rev_8_21_14_0_20_39_38]